MFQIETASNCCRRHTQSGSWRLRIPFVGALLCCIGFTSCIVAPVPMTKRMEVSGSASVQKVPDLTLLHAGQSSRQEVLHQLAAIDTGYGGEDLFFGRWVSSGSGWIWFIAGDDTGAGGYWRNWRVHNVLVTFDENGMVKDLNKVDDKRLLGTAARLPHSQFYSGDLSIPIDMYVRRQFQRPVALLLKADFIAFDHPDPPKIYFHITPREVSRLRLIRCHHPDPGSVQMQLDFRGKTALGRRVVFRIAPPDLLRLTEYLQTANPTALQ